MLTAHVVLPVVEGEETKIPDGEGNEITVPVNMGDPNPNGVEFDSLYLDMNGIVSMSVCRGRSYTEKCCCTAGPSMYTPRGQACA